MAIVGLGALVAAVLIGLPDRKAERQVQTGTPVAAWDSIKASGGILGTQGGSAVIVEFSDFQCPACRRLHVVIDSLVRVRKDVEVRFRHLPLTSIHPHALTAAIASECSAAQGRFDTMHDAFFADQRNIGVLPWEDFARRAGVPNLTKFTRCLKDPSTHARVQVDRDLAARLGFTATPTLIVDGVRYYHFFGALELGDTVAAAVARHTALGTR